MNQETRESGGPRATVAGWITATLSTAAGCAIAFGVWLALGTADTEPLESPLMLSVARQLDHGPWGLYGPFGGQNPLVLIHAPLYYHLAAIAAWVVRQGGSDPITAARLAGRGLSLAGLLITAWCALRIARLDGPRPRAGWWAACLCAAAPVVGTMPYTVRPDMLGVAVQTTGVLLVLKALGRPRPAGRLIAGGFAALGLAICIKQHLAGGLFVSTALLLWEWGRGRVSSRLVGLAMLTAAGVVAVVYGVEEVATEGRMSTALLVAAPAIARVHPADPVRAGITLANIGGGSTCLIALLAFAALAQVAGKPGLGRRVAASLGTVVAGFTLCIPLLDFVHRSVALSLTATAAPFVCAFLVIPACALIERRGLFGSWLDPALCLFVAAEMVIVALLCLASTGAWVNYAIQGIVFAAILTGRSLSRACEETPAGTYFFPLGLAALAVLVFGLEGAYITFDRLRSDRLAAEAVVRNVGEPGSTFYFAGGPGENREFGRTDLVFDDWLYPVFESVHAAEPRSVWLRQALADGSIRFVITTSDRPWVDGVGEPLNRLGYTARAKVGPLYVWEQLRSQR